MLGYPAHPTIGDYILDTGKLPHFFRWGGGGVPFSWSFGWLTGKDKDLVCVRPSLHTPTAGEINLSPVCSNRLLALIAFSLKAILVRLDQNLSVQETRT